MRPSRNGVRAVVERRSRILAMTVIVCWPALAASAQPAPPTRSVWVSDYPPAALTAAVASGKSTLIYSGGSSTAVANHVEVARYVARRVAEELANAFVMPVDGAAADAATSTASDAFEGVNGAIRSGGFRDVVIIADEGAGPADRTLRDLAARLETQWQPAGVRVLFVTAHEERPGQGMTLNADYLRRWGSRTVPPERRKIVEDQAELLFADSERAWFRPEMIAAEDRAVVVPALGKILLEQRVSSILHQIRSQAFWQAAAPTPASPQNRLSAIPADRMTAPLQRALAEYREVRPDGLGELGGAGAGGEVGAGGPNLWTVYVHLPEILGPLRQLHEQVHVNPRISQKLVHFIIMIVARHWTNDIWTAHDEDSIKEGLSRDTVVALEEGRYPPNMAEDERIAYAFCTELLRNHRVSDATYAEAVAMFGEEGVVQTAVTVSLYSYLSLAVNMAYPEAASAGRLAPFPQ
jgi:4-carboxymuconolactone decarboxylase